MPFTRYMTREEMAATLTALDQSLYRHDQWIKNLESTLICRLPPDLRDVSETPHRFCPFGQWYYSGQKENLSKHPGFVALATDHELMHEVAAHMLELSVINAPIEVSVFERFDNAATRMREEIRSLQHELGEGLRNRDPLTGASSRIEMLTELRTQQELVKRNLQSCLVAMMDLDRFKTVNDEHGHQAGDAVLAEASRRVMSGLRPYDRFFRYGGEEFLLFAPELNLESGQAFVERLRNLISTVPIVMDNGRELFVTASFGFTLLDPDVPVEETITRADRALTRAKEAGRNKALAWGPSLA